MFDLAQQIGATPDVARFRQRRAGDAGIALNLEQELAADLGVFLRASIINDGRKEAYEFTEILGLRVHVEG